MEKQRAPWSFGTLGTCAIGLLVGFVTVMVMYGATVQQKKIEHLKQLMVRSDHLERDQHKVRAAKKDMERLTASIVETEVELDHLDGILPAVLDPEAEAAAIAEVVGLSPDIMRVRVDGDPVDRDFYREHRFVVEIDRILPAELLNIVDRIHADGRLRTVEGMMLDYGGTDPQPGELRIVVYQFKQE